MTQPQRLEIEGPHLELKNTPYPALIKKSATNTIAAVTAIAIRNQLKYISILYALCVIKHTKVQKLLYRSALCA